MLSFASFLTEKVLSIGLNPDHEKFRDQHSKEIHDIIHHSYKDIGGYAGHASGSKEESDAIHHDIKHSVIKAVKRDGKITAVNLYRKQHGLKSIASGTNGTDQGKTDWKKTKLEDHEHKRAWGEVSGAVEKLQHRMGVPKIKSSEAEKLTGKKVKPTPGDEHKYTRKIGDHEHEKTIMGHPKYEK